MTSADAILLIGRGDMRGAADAYMKRVSPVRVER
jgi:hypothetical protein